ncbi:subtilisin-like protein [Punctularia strigosozonata HHB-11173 SS5]|uniref:subtilisin-like protein n=1 Tax=Punctularia strigosozonata (strain HHB-11173) TaxID=741275 RepID=UPI0004416279|nr:subtilisin-like protein [Punctularia strigosozonata HHB-11173 SS5]EIN09489.1 subtilisin-like protein [Punctularia strigosozonata HHB-11173 SS5]
MLWSSLVTVVVYGLAQVAQGKPLGSKRWDELSIKHEWVEVPRGWTLEGPAPAEHKFVMRLALKQDGFDELVRHLYEVSEPTHERYGNHLSKEEVDALIAPHPDTADLVEAWLAHHGIQSSDCHRSDAGDWIKVSVSVEQAEQMLSTKYNVYTHETTGEQIVRAMSYSLPSVLEGHIETVAPTTYFGTMRAMRATNHVSPVKPIENDHELQALVSPGNLATVPASCATTITPTCLRALYNSSTYVPKATATNVIGVAGYLEEFANNADLQTFFNRFRTDAVGQTFETVLVNGGGNNQNEPGTEANLDIQYTEGITAPTPNVYFSTGGSPPFTPDSFTTTNSNEPYLDFLDFLGTQSSIPQTISTSYGDDEQTVPKDYATSVCNLFAQFGARGTSFLFSSGDEYTDAPYPVRGVGGGSCRTNDGTNVVRFQPEFPASCPFVTAVGGTIKINPEVAVSFSGGGFSNYFAQPSYQTAKVQTFLTALGSTNEGLFNASGRAYPDVAAQSEGFQVVIGGRVTSVAGTSASAPTMLIQDAQTFAGIVALLNDFRLSNGKSSLGFLNPLLYSATTGLTDITSGSNPGCSTNGFTARAGWDPVTGLGTPDFGRLQSVVLNA